MAKSFLPEHIRNEQPSFQNRVQRSRPAEPFKPRFARSRNISHHQFGMLYEREPETRSTHSGHFTGGVIYTAESSRAGRGD